MNTYFTTQFVGSAPPVSLGPQRSGQAARFSKLAQQLHEIVAEATSFDAVAMSILHAIEEYSQCQLTGLYQLQSDGSLQSPFQLGTLTADSAESGEFERIVRTSLQRACPIGLIIQETEQLAVVAVPIRAVRQSPLALGLCAKLGAIDLPGLAVLAEMAAGAIGHVVTQDSLQRLEWEAQVAAATCELATRIQCAESYDQALILTVNELKRFFQCQQVGLAIVRRNRPGVDLQAVSGLSEFDRSSAAIRLLAAALDEIAVRNEFTLWPPREGQPRHATLALRKLAESNRTDAIIGIPLRTSDDEIVGTIVAEGVRLVVHEPQQLTAWQAIAPHVAAAIRSRRKADKRLWEVLTPSSKHRKYRRFALAAAVALVSIAFLPVPHRVRTDCRVEPVVRRFVVAPYSGRLRETRVDPGDLVGAGEVLATMDDRELSFELTSLSAERFRAAKERDTAMADHDPSAAQMAALEMERLDARIALLRERTKNLEIVSPIAGIVLKGDLRDAEGAPVNIGQALFEVAPLDPIELELSIPAEEIAWARRDQSVSARLDGHPTGKITGTVRIVHPRAEIRDGKNVFIANVSLTNSDQLMRPGMNGRAWIRAGYRPLAWLWLHKAVHRVRMITGW